MEISSPATMNYKNNVRYKATVWHGIINIRTAEYQHGRYNTRFTPLYGGVMFPGGAIQREYFLTFFYWYEPQQCDFSYDRFDPLMDDLYGGDDIYCFDPMVPKY